MNGRIKCFTVQLKGLAASTARKHEDDVMAFRVPLKLFTDHRCVMRINSKQFVHGIMRTNQMDTSKTYVLSGEFLEEKNTAVFSLVEGVSLRTQKGMAQS